MCAVVTVIFVCLSHFAHFVLHCLPWAVCFRRGEDRHLPTPVPPRAAHHREGGCRQQLRSWTLHHWYVQCDHMSGSSYRYPLPNAVLITGDSYSDMYFVQHRIEF
jgi:hypothetical protein